MVTDFFGSILQDIGKILKIQNLHPDANNTCLIKFKERPSVQLEMDKSGTFFVIGINLGNIPSGRYRENLFAEALKANGLPHPRYGTFAYSRKADNLVLFEMLPLKDLTADKVTSVLPSMLEKANRWKEAISRGEMPQIEQQEAAGSGKGMFGL